MSELKKWQQPWRGAMEPFQVFGNLYFIGTQPASSHMIDTGDGLMLIDTGYQHGLYLLINNIWKLGFNPADIKYILLTHGHIDHFGSVQALKELTGCKVVLGEKDKTYATGEEDLSWAKELDTYLETFEPDILINDGDEIKLGNTTVKAVATPGHTPGAMSYFFDVTDGIETFRAGMPGGLGVNSVKKQFLESYGLPLSLQQDYLNSMDRLKDEKVDIFIGNHVHNNDTIAKYDKLIKGDKYAFVAPDDWKECMLNCKKKFQDIMNNEQ
jgi:metallo-beta-lactamase class B